MASTNPQVRAIELEASRRAAEDGETSHAERFAIRNALRADAGLPAEQRKRGGAAGVYDRNKQFALPLAMLAAPFALPALGGALGLGGAAGAGGAASGAAGAAAGAVPAAIPAASSGGLMGTLGGLAGKAKDFLTADGGRNIMGIVGAVDAASQRRRADDLTNRAIGLDTNRWQAGAPLREAGMAGLLAPTPGNPFALGAGATPPPAPLATPKAVPAQVQGQASSNPLLRRLRSAVPATGGSR